MFNICSSCFSNTMYEYVQYTNDNENIAYNRCLNKQLYYLVHYRNNAKVLFFPRAAIPKLGIISVAILKTARVTKSVKREKSWGRIWRLLHHLTKVFQLPLFSFFFSKKYEFLHFGFYFFSGFQNIVKQKTLFELHEIVALYFLSDLSSFCQKNI